MTHIKGSTFGQYMKQDNRIITLVPAFVFTKQLGYHLSKYTIKWLPCGMNLTMRDELLLVLNHITTSCDIQSMNELEVTSKKY